MQHVRRKVFLAATIIAVLAAGGIAWWWVRDWPVRKFAAVERGVLYRSAQPTEAGWRRLRDHYRIRTVLDLREEKPDAPWAVLEREFCAANNINHIRLPISGDGMTDEQLKTVIETLSDAQYHPVLVHCELGKVRTGLVVAAYRIILHGWSYEQALEENDRYKEYLTPNYEAYLQELEAGKHWPPRAPRTVGEDAATSTGPDS